jgi:DNA invertase Pin-like site-specific DNA recombinase
VRGPLASHNPQSGARIEMGEAARKRPRVLRRRAMAATTRRRSPRDTSLAAAGRRATGDLLGYARVSKDQQNLAIQLDALGTVGCRRIFRDVGSGSLKNRPQLDECLRFLEPGDTLVVWRLDRLGRGLKHLIEVVEELEARKVGFKSLTEDIDTTTSGGRLTFHIFGVLAQIRARCRARHNEHALMSKRTVDGLAAVRARGRTGGQKPSSEPARSSWPAGCTTRPTRTASANTRSRRSPLSSASADRRSTGIWTRWSAHPGA